MTPEHVSYLRRSAPFLLALLLWLARRYGGRVAQRVPSQVVPWVALALGALWGWLGPQGQAEVDSMVRAIDGMQSAGMAAAGAWGLTAVVRKRKRTP